MSIIKNYRLRLDAGNITPLIIHVNQYDKNEIWNFTLIDYQGNQYITTEAAIVGKKPDGCLIVNNCTVSEGIVSVEVTEQMTAAAGKAVFELLVDGQLHGTANFIVMIERSPQDGAIESESDLSLFQQAIDATSTPAIIAGVQAWMDENLTPTTPVVDSSLSISGAAADAKKTGDEISELKSEIDDIEEQIGEGVDGLTSAIKSALLQLAEKVGYENSADGNTVYNDLYDALYPAIVYTALTLNRNSLSFGSLNTTQSLVATTTPRGGNVTWSSSNTSVATVSQTGVVTSVGYGSATITASCGGLTATCSVAISQATVTSISAVYTQGVVDTATALNSLKSDLVVTASWSNGTTSTVASADYTLSGTLTVGTSTITVNYSGKTTTFNVEVSEHVATGWYYPFNGSLVSEGTNDFSFTGTENYTTGFDNRQAYLHKVETEGTSSTDAMAIKATNLSQYPDFSGDFTISFWHKSFTNLKGHPFAMSKFLGNQTSAVIIQSSIVDAGNGWTCDGSARATKKYTGVTWWWYSDQLVIALHSADSATGSGYSSQFKFTPPSGYSTLTWHHYALTRNGNNIYFFVDGVLQTTIICERPLYSCNQITLGSLFYQSTTQISDVQPMSYGDAIQDLYIAESCKWTSGFDPENIVY